MAKVSALYIYPIKSLGGIAVNDARVTDRGLEYDRRWMLVDEDNRFLSQREVARMALITVAINEAGLLVTYQGDSLTIPFSPATNETGMVTVWDSVCEAQYVSPAADEWFSWVLGLNCRLVYMPDDSKRLVDEDYASGGEITSFSDGYPILLISQASLDDLNIRMGQSLPMNRFRPNIVISDTEPYFEDRLNNFTISGIRFKGVKRCARCVVTTIDQQTAIAHKEPLKTLATYRRKGKKIMFGQNILHYGTGTISIGDELGDITLHSDERFVVA